MLGKEPLEIKGCYSTYCVLQNYHSFFLLKKKSYLAVPGLNHGMHDLQYLFKHEGSLVAADMIYLIAATV